LEKILGEIEKDPETLVEFLNILPRKPEVADFVKRLYDLELAEEKLEKHERHRIREW
jgi:hypothetical protein